MMPKLRERYVFNFIDFCTHCVISKMENFSSHERLRHVISNHCIGWTVSGFDLLTLNQVCDVEILDVEVTSLFALTCLPIFLELHRTGVVAVYNSRFHDMALSLNKQF